MTMPQRTEQDPMDTSHDREALWGSETEAKRLGEKAVDLEKAGRVRAAAKMFERSIIEGGTQAQRVIDIENYGNLLLRNGHLHKADEYYKRALRIDDRYEPHNQRSPTYIKLLDNYAILLQREGRYGEATRVYQKALRLNPDNGMSHYNLACLLAQEEDDTVRNPYRYIRGAIVSLVG